MSTPISSVLQLCPGDNTAIESLLSSASDYDKKNANDYVTSLNVIYKWNRFVVWTVSELEKSIVPYYSYEISKLGLTQHILTTAYTTFLHNRHNRIDAAIVIISGAGEAVMEVSKVNEVLTWTWVDYQDC